MDQKILKMLCDRLDRLEILVDALKKEKTMCLADCFDILDQKGKDKKPYPTEFVGDMPIKDYVSGQRWRFRKGCPITEENANILKDLAKLIKEGKNDVKRV